MKKIATLIIASGLFVGLLTSCGNSYTYEESELTAVVTDCQQGDFHPDAAYMATASSYLAQQNYGMYNMYMALAETNGKYDYNVTITINDESYTVVRDDIVSVGTEIHVTMVKKFDENELIETSYK